MLGPWLSVLDVRICRSRPVSAAVSENVDRKLDLLIKELKRY